MAGFGRSPFGRGPFGRSDIGRDLTVASFPDTYFDDTIELDPGETIKDNDKDPLLKFLNTMGFQVNKRREEIDTLPSLLDYEKASLEIVQLWGNMLGLGIDKNDPEFLQRTILGNASQWLQIKSSVQGYSVRALASRFVVFIDNFWRIDASYVPLIPARHLFYLKPKTADASAQKTWHTDSPPGTYVGTPTEEDETYAKSSYIKLIFEIAEPRNNTIDYNKALDLVIDKIKEVVAIHHEIQAPEFRVHMLMQMPYSLSMQIHELANDQVNIWNHYDIVAADEIPCDSGYPLMEMIPGDVQTMSFGFNITMDANWNEQFTSVVDIGGDPEEESFHEHADLEISMTPSLTMIIQDITPVGDMIMNVPFSMNEEFDEESNSEFSGFVGMSMDTFDEEAQNNVNLWQRYDNVPGDEIEVDAQYPLIEDEITET